MPHRRVARGVFAWIGRHTEVVMVALLVISTILALAAAIGFLTARNAQHRVTALEVDRAAEKAAAATAKVTTCFQGAQNRPRLVIILRALAGEVSDPISRGAFDDLITDYEHYTPTVPACKRLADRLGVNWRPLIRPPGTVGGTNRQRGGGE